MMASHASPVVWLAAFFHLPRSIGDFSQSAPVYWRLPMRGESALHLLQLLASLPSLVWPYPARPAAMASSMMSRGAASKRATPPFRRDFLIFLSVHACRERLPHRQRLFRRPLSLSLGDGGEQVARRAGQSAHRQTLHSPERSTSRFSEASFSSSSGGLFGVHIV